LFGHIGELQTVSAPAGIPALVDAIRHLHGVESRHVETVHVHEKTPAGAKPS
jgi:hypothetical protein